MAYPDEVRIVQNPCLGAVIIWHFSDAYTKESKKAVPFLLLFLVLPIVFHRALRGFIKSTQNASGFPKVLEKLVTSHQSDLLESINSHCIELRSVSLSSVRILLRLNLAAINISNAEVLTSMKAPLVDDGGETADMVAVARKLGRWLSSRSLYEIGMLMRVRF